VTLLVQFQDALERSIVGERADHGAIVGPRQAVGRPDLRQRQLDASFLVQEYTARLGEIEHIIRRERLMTLSPGQPTIRVATAAENNMYGAPVTICPQSRTKPEDTAQCETVMPLALPVGNKGEATPVEDYTLAAASWTLTAHEIRPGHELQFDAMIANGTSMTRRSSGCHAGES
jgi:hypothetical protein